MSAAAPAAEAPARSKLLVYLDQTQESWKDLKTKIYNKTPTNPVTPHLGRFVTDLKSNFLPSALSPLSKNVTDLLKNKFPWLLLATTALSVTDRSYLWDTVSGTFTLLTAAVDLDKNYRTLTSDAALLLGGRHALNLLVDSFNILSGNYISGGIGLAIDLAFAAKLGLIIIDRHSS